MDDVHAAIHTPDWHFRSFAEIYDLGVRFLKLNAQVRNGRIPEPRNIRSTPLHQLLIGSNSIEVHEGLQVGLSNYRWIRCPHNFLVERKGGRWLAHRRLLIKKCK